MQPTSRNAADIILLGAGPSHLQVLRRFAVRRPMGARLTLVTPEPEVSDAGLLPALISGECPAARACIDLGPLAAAAGARLILAEATGLDLAACTLDLAGRPPLPFDLLSADLIGDSALPALGDAGIPTSPPDRFLDRLAELEATLPDTARLAVIGGGPAAAALALALARRFRGRFRLALVSESPEPLADAPPRARRAFRAALVQAGVEQVSAVQAGALIEGRLALSDGSFLPADAVLWAADTSPPGFLAESGLACDAAGRVLVQPSQRSVSHARIFAAGDCAAAPPRPAVAGPLLAASLRRAAIGRRQRGLLPRWRPAPSAPTMLDLGDGRAVAWGHGLALTGRLAGRGKHWLDERRLRSYVPRVGASGPAPRRIAAQPSPGVPASGLPRMAAPDALIGLGTSEHTAVLTPPVGQALVQSVASLRCCLDDPFVFGQVAAAHALSEHYAMGARPWTALAIATAPGDARCPLASAELRFMLAGAAELLGADGCALVGGHRSEAAETSLGFAVCGLAEQSRLLRKAELRAGDLLLLTKPLGSGIVLAAQARGAARGSWSRAAADCMRTSNAAASRILRAHGAGACAAVNGSGLTGHLGEMLAASRAAAVVWPEAVPALPGALELAAAGTSALRGRGKPPPPGNSGADGYAALLTDPQTSGGLLAGVPPARADACLRALQAAGLQAAIIGLVEEAVQGTPMIRMEQG